MHLQLLDREDDERELRQKFIINTIYTNICMVYTMYTNYIL